MKRYDICLGADGIESQDGNWVPAEVAQALYDALKKLHEKSFYRFHGYLGSEEFEVVHDALSLADGEE